MSSPGYRATTQDEARYPGSFGKLLITEPCA